MLLQENTRSTTICNITREIKAETEVEIELRIRLRFRKIKDAL